MFFKKKNFHLLRKCKMNFKLELLNLIEHQKRKIRVGISQHNKSFKKREKLQKINDTVKGKYYLL